MLSVPFWGAPTETFPAATEGPVGSCWANAGNGAAMTSESAMAITRVASGGGHSATGPPVAGSRIRRLRFVII
jgi:hypothetical protein